jgi:hypothetical protein
MKWYEDLRYNKDLKWIKGDIIEPTDLMIECMQEIEYQYEQVRFQEYNGGILLRRSYHRDLSGPVF